MVGQEDPSYLGGGPLNHDLECHIQSTARRLRFLDDKSPPFSICYLQHHSSRKHGNEKHNVRLHSPRAV